VSATLIRETTHKGGFEMLESTERTVHAVMRSLPHRIGEGTDWFEAPNGYPWHAQVLHLLQPKKYVEFGTHVGYSLIAALHGALSIEQVAWADNETYVPHSNQLALENLNAYLFESGRTVAINYCNGVEDLIAAEPESVFLAPYRDADVLFVDGDHGYEGALRDMRLAKCLGARIVLVDDATEDCCPGVIEAIRCFAQEEECTFGIVHTFRGLAIFDLSIPKFATSFIFSRLKETGIQIEYANNA
jgi:hypothetical protein